MWGVEGRKRLLAIYCNYMLRPPLECIRGTVIFFFCSLSHIQCSHFLGNRKGYILGDVYSLGKISRESPEKGVLYNNSLILEKMGVYLSPEIGRFRGLQVMGNKHTRYPRGSMCVCHCVGGGGGGGERLLHLSFAAVGVRKEIGWAIFVKTQLTIGLCTIFPCI